MMKGLVADNKGRLDHHGSKVVFVGISMIAIIAYFVLPWVLLIPFFFGGDNIFEVNLLSNLIKLNITNPAQCR